MKKILSLVFAACFCLSIYPSNLFAVNAKYSVSGFVTNGETGAAVHGADVKIEGDKEASKKTDSTGYYRIDGIENGSKIEIYVYKESLSFAPSVFKIANLNSNRTINFKTSKPAPKTTSSPKGVPSIEKPATGTTPIQPEYVQKTTPFFAADEKPKNKDDDPSKPTFTVSGRVSYYASGLVGVKVVANNDRRLTTTTDVNGVYSIKGLKKGEDYIFFFSKEGYEFSPEDIIVTENRDTEVNVEAFASKLKISGSVLDGKNAIEGAKIKITSGIDEYETETNESGNYEVEGLTFGHNFIVTAHKEGVVITPLRFVVNQIESDRVVDFNAAIRKYDVSGKVVDSATGKPVKYASVGISAKKYVDKISATSKGKFIFEDLSAGEAYTLTSESENYKLTAPVKIADLQSNVDLVIKMDSSAAVADGKTSSAKANASAAIAAKPVKSEPAKTPAAKEGKKVAETPKKESKAAPKDLKAEKEAEKTKAAKLKADEKAAEEKAKADEKLKKEAEKEAAAKAKSEEKAKKEAEKAEAARIKAEEKAKKEQDKAASANTASTKRIAKTEAKKETAAAVPVAAVAVPVVAAKPVSETKVKEVKAKEPKAKEAKKEEPKVKETKAKEAKKEEPKVAAVVAAPKAKYVKIRGKIANKQETVSNIELTMEPGGYKTTTDEKGRYSFDNIPENPRYLLKPNSSNILFEPAQAVLNDVVSNVNQDFVPYVRIEGEVFVEGKAVSGVSIQSGGVQIAVTDQFGKYKIPSFEYGSQLTANAVKSGYSFYPALIDIPKVLNNIDNLNFIVAYSVAGRVTTQGSVFGLSNLELEITGGTKAVISADYGGNYLITGLEQGKTFRISPKAGGYAFDPPFKEYTELKSNLVGQNFTAIKQTYSVTGNVSVGRKPLKNTMISITKRPIKYYTDDEGNFEIANLDYGGPYIVTVSSREHDFEPFVIETLKENTYIEFSTDISLGGTVMSGQRPMPNVVVDINGQRQKTDENGKYLIKGMQYNGDYLISFSAPGMVFTPNFKEYKNIKKSVLNESVDASYVLSGKVSLDDKGLEGAAIVVGGDEATYKSDANGYYLIQNLKYGQDYNVEVVYPGYKFTPASKEYKNVTSSRLSENYKAVPLGYTVKGTVTGKGRLLNNVAVVIEGDNNVKKQTLTNAKGEYKFEGMMPGKRYKITVNSKSVEFESPSGIINNLNGDTEIFLKDGMVATPSSMSENQSDAVVKELQRNQAKSSFFNVNGKITVNGEPVTGVVIKSKMGEAVTGNSGEYSISIDAGDDLIIEPYYAGYLFTPATITLRDIREDKHNVNFTAEAKVHVLSGYIVDGKNKGVKNITVKSINSGDTAVTDSKGFYKLQNIRHQEKNTILPESSEYYFYPANVETILQADEEINDIYAYPKTVKKAEVFVYGGKKSNIRIKNSNIYIVMLSPESGRVSIEISDKSKNIITEFAVDLSANKISAVEWNGETSTGSSAGAGEYTITLNGAGYKKTSEKFSIER